MIDLSVNLSGVPLDNPTVLASGLMGVSAASLQLVEKNGAGAVTCKSIGPKERIGHHNPTVYAWEHGITNAVGLSNPGTENSIPYLKEAKEKLKVPLFVSIFADKVTNLVKVAEQMMTINPIMIELNLSCPNTEDDFGRMFSLDPKTTAYAVSSVKKVSGKTKIFAKLNADVSDIIEIGKSAEQAGADGITVTNTLSSMIIDIKLKKPILKNMFGGLSGPAVKPIAIRAVYNLYKSVKIPIIGLGGINTGEDAIEFIMAGASVVGIGSGIYYRGIDVFKKVTEEMKKFMKEEGYKNLDEIRGVAHRVK